MPEVADAPAVLVGFARTLRAAGVRCGPDRVQAFLAATVALDPRRRADVYWAGRLTLCADPEDLSRYDAAFAAYFTGEAPHRRMRAAPPRHLHVLPSSLADDDGGPVGEGDAPPLAAGASRHEVLRRTDLARLDEHERADVHRLLSSLDLVAEVRRTRRTNPARSGRVDRAATVRELLHAGGEPAHLRFVRRRVRARRVVVMVDVSGSMSPYATSLLRFAHAAARRRLAPTEVFTIGTRLTRVTRELSHRDPDSAMAAVAAAVPDIRGGTRLGELLKEWLDRWGQRGMARGAVVVLLSDGWERGDATLLGEQMARLGRLAHRVVWANPRKAAPGYEPLVAGMAAALPHVDDFVEGHSLDALHRLARTIAGASGGKQSA